jgi:hypothetical protein
VTSSLPHPDQWSAWDPCVDANPERSPRDIGEPFGLTHAAVSRRLTARTRAPCTHGAPDDAIQRIATVHSGAPNGAPATAHHRQVKDVLDLAWRRVWAQVGQEVGRA